ncbi:hypothetical protein PIIN_11506 [Serendipita indica DSM 11827]|uniref:Uncharacterized protein n=1 Tax=Serendipita indica (strain DSM 11827) TaxID=1109443 RepID=G4U1T6_SERID|nr:hypothetical protein PIIN_11506 [Serendipita indica DSM 11827]
MSSYGLDQFDFPHLRHLAIRQITTSFDWIYPVLERWGKELITFKLRSFERRYRFLQNSGISFPNFKVIRLSESPPVMELLPGVSNLSSGANTV